MPDFTDLLLRKPDAGRVLLIFDQGRQFIDLTGAPSGRIATPVSTAEGLKAALATPGNYQVVPGTYVGNFVVTAPGVTVVCSPGVELRTSDPSKPNLQVSASSFAWQGGMVYGSINDAIIVGSFNATTVEQQPNGVLFSGVKVQAPDAGAKRGFALHGCAITILSCDVRGYYRPGQEGQAVWIHNGPGPYSIVDSYLEAAGENLLVGGEVFAIPGVVPSDIHIAHCVFRKTDAMHTNAAAWKVKNSLELKNARRVLIENCLFDGCWKGGQSGSPIVFTVRNSGAAQTTPIDNPWVIVDDVTFRHNIVRNAPDYYAINILGHDTDGRASEQTKTIIIEDNLFEHSPGGVQVGSAVTDMLRINRNCFPAVNGNLLMFVEATKGKTALVMNENSGKTSIYGINLASGSQGPGLKTLALCCSSYEVTGNILERTVFTNSSGGKTTALISLPAGNTQVVPGTLGLDPATFVLPGGAAGWSGPDGIAQ